MSKKNRNRSNRMRSFEKGQRNPGRSINSQEKLERSSKLEQSAQQERGINKIRKRTFLAVASTLGIVAAAGYFGKSNPKSTDKDTADYVTQLSVTAPTNETAEKKEITLGNVHFHLQEQGNLTNAEVNTLFQNLEAAYSKLENYFGEDVMTMQSPIDCPIIIQPKTSEFQPMGRVRWLGVNANLNTDTGDLHFTPPKNVTLTLRTTDEDFIAHELVHLLAQANINLSETFHEGHAHAIQKHLYGDAVVEGETNKIAGNKAVREALNIGLDDNMYDRNRMGGGVQNNELNLVLKIMWEMQWRNYLKENPDYFKKFYREIARRKKAGTYTLSKEDFMEISEEVSPGFKEWMHKQTPSMENIDTKGGQKILKAIVEADKKTIYLINIQTGSVQKGNYTAAKLQPLLTGPILLHLKDKNTNQERSIRIPRKAETFIIIDIQGGIPSHLEITKLTVGGREVPLI
jgi:hypothetical protein